MNVLTVIVLIFAVAAAADRIVGNRFGLGKEFEKAFNLLGPMALSMIGMIVLAPLLADLMRPLSSFVSGVLRLDPSIIPASLFANDMGGASLSTQMAADEKLGAFNALVVSSMMGCTMSFTIPFSLGVVDKKYHKELLLGILCGIVTIPVGCFIAGLLCKISVIALIIDLLPLVLFSAALTFGLIKCPDICVRIFKIFGIFITALITVGLVFGMLNFLSGKEIIKGLGTVEEGIYICINASVVLAGMFPLVYAVSKLFAKPLRAVGNKVGINEISVLGIFSCLSSNSTTFGLVDKMDKKGIVLASAFSVSGAFVFGSHLAFTAAFGSDHLLPVIAGKLISGISSLFIAALVYKKRQRSAE